MMNQENSQASTLYVSDMDGTLLGSDSQVSATSAQLLNQAIEGGALFTVATARTPATVVPLMSAVNANLPFICLNGAAMWDNRRRDYTHVEVLPDATVQHIVDIYERHGLHPFIYRRHGHLINAYHYGPMSAQESQFVAERQGLELKKFVLDNPHYRHVQGESAMLIFSMLDYERLRPVYEEIKASVHCSPVFYHDIFDNTAGILEIYAPGVSKAAAIKRLASQVQASRIVVFGDNRNDLPMMRIASHSVAVGNAFQEVKDAAREVIGPNTDDAVAKYISEKK